MDATPKDSKLVEPFLIDYRAAGCTCKNGGMGRATRCPRHGEAAIQSAFVAAMRFGCPFCGASSNEACISENTSLDMDMPHGERLRFSAVHERSLDGSVDV